jgi:hypothetical protein
MVSQTCRPSTSVLSGIVTRWQMDGQRLMIISLAFLAVDHRQQLSMLSVGRNNNLGTTTQNFLVEMLMDVGCLMVQIPLCFLVKLRYEDLLVLKILESSQDLLRLFN